MIVDFHVHIAIENQGMWTPEVWELVRKHYPDKYNDIQRYGQDPNLFRTYLESQGIQKCVLLAEDSNQTGLVPNDYILEYCEQEPDFYIPFLAMNPNKTGSLLNRPEQFRKNVAFCCELLQWLAEKGFRGIKDYGSYNHIPFGTEHMYPFYEKAAELNLPVLFHTGESIFDSEKSKMFASPEGLENLAIKIPGLSIIIGHCGSGKYFPVAYRLAKKYPNIYLEFSGVPPHLIKKHFFDKELDLNMIPDKLIFGSDYPALPNGLDGIKKNIETCKNLADQNILTRKSLDGLLGLNAMKFFK
ncbi:MAG: hypothetical protein A2161_10480 [Candidatus Schekmanbacteria bacterium RBG_13_48_7]|uniref:Amidohydrolase-related domain-containing protein n=1 Tax=Candidatus Schekmanbacteria bacterium RBG_13_48_7 TaxID=1817878 RepID=A0A1F7RYH8_9BACT|nr:MAG: hypothetical protein A2161_10480 [Candidatus Schekmanbacteria bacterium RBG_13_48_7]